MNLQQAITVLDSTIPPSNNKMVDMEHLPIAQAWETIKAALKLGQIQTEGRLTAYNDGLPYFPECFKEPCSGMGCKKKDCEFMTDVCRKLAAFEDEEEKRNRIKREQCCMCPGAICPGIPGTPHPEASPCRFFEEEKK